MQRSVVLSCYAATHLASREIFLKPQRLYEALKKSAFDSTISSFMFVLLKNGRCAKKPKTGSAIHRERD